MKKRILSLALALVLCLGLSVPAFATSSGSNEFLDSGSTSIAKLSKEEIAQLLEDNPLTLPAQVFDVQPSTSAPYASGKVSVAALQAAVDRLNALRQIAGLPAVQLDLTLSEQAQYGAVIQGALGTLNHYPSKPAGMDDNFYQLARGASSSSNLSAGRTLTEAIDGFMDDSDASNIDRVGHRRWQLNPSMGKVGLGYAESNTMYRRYVAEHVFDGSGTCRDYDFVAWPASGNFPNSLSGFDRNTAWSVSLNPSEYSTPRQSDLTVILTRESDGKTWTFQGSNYTATNSGAYYHVDTGGYGISNCIIFRPEGITSYEGVYTVTINGLKSVSGVPVDFSYQVDFFNPETLGQTTEPEQPTRPEQTTQPGQSGTTDFVDVPTTHWAYSYVKRAAENGWVKGVGNNQFAPNNTLTFAEFYTMIVPVFASNELAAYQAPAGSPWWQAYMYVGGKNLPSETISFDTFYGGPGPAPNPDKRFQDSIDKRATEAIPRSDAITIMWRVLEKYGLDEQVPGVEEARAKIEADLGILPLIVDTSVPVCYAAGLISGDQNGNLNLDNTLTRAEGCVMLCNLVDYVTSH